MVRTAKMLHSVLSLDCGVQVKTSGNIFTVRNSSLVNKIYAFHELACERRHLFPANPSQDFHDAIPFYPIIIYLIKTQNWRARFMRDKHAMERNRELKIYDVGLLAKIKCSYERCCIDRRPPGIQKPWEVSWSKTRWKTWSKRRRASAVGRLRRWVSVVRPWEDSGRRARTWGSWVWVWARVNWEPSSWLSIESWTFAGPDRRRGEARDVSWRSDLPFSPGGLKIACPPTMFHLGDRGTLQTGTAFITVRGIA